MAHRTERQRAWHSLHRQLGRIPEPEEVDAELARRRTIREQSGNNPGNKPPIPVEQATPRGTDRAERTGTKRGIVEGTEREQSGNNETVPTRTALVPLITCPHCGRSFAYVP